ncbi:MAG: KamA family radical SAM protein, partial [Bradymonadaceae bacterium]
MYDERPDLFDDADRSDWTDWHWQQRNRLRTAEDFAAVVDLTDDERRALEGADGDALSAAATPYYASLMDPADPDCPVRRQAIPLPDEAEVQPWEKTDPLAEDSHMPVPGVTHRYPDRVLFYVTHNCPVYCRHCTRKRKVSDPQTAASREQIRRGLDYIRETEQVRDVLLSGGDPLTLSDERLGEILGELDRVDHLDVVRLGTRNPVTLPHRVTDDLCEVLSQFRPLYLNTHFNHPRELTERAVRALRDLADAGCVLGNQMVLLDGINDTPETVLD